MLRSKQQVQVVRTSPLEEKETVSYPRFLNSVATVVLRAYSLLVL